MPPITRKSIIPDHAIGPAPRYPFVGRASTAQIFGIAVFFGVAIWALIAALDLVAARYGPALLLPMSALDAVVGLICGILLFKLMLLERSRVLRVTARLRAIGDINHHVRNALDEIELSAYMTHNKQLAADIECGVKRIEWAIKELLPDTVEQRERPE